MRLSTMKRFGLALVIFFWLFISASADGQKENDTESLQAIEERIGQYEQIMDTTNPQEAIIFL